KRSSERRETETAAEKKKQKVREAIEELPTAARENVTAAFARYEKAHLQQVKRLSEEVQLYRTLATAGISAATLAHESEGGTLKRITMSANLIEDRAREDLEPGTYTKRYEKPLARLRESLLGLGVLGDATLRLVEHQKRRQGKVFPHEVIREVFVTYEPFLKGRGIEWVHEFASGSPFLFGSEAALESIVTNLLNNSAVAFEGVQRVKRQILVRTSVDDALVMRLLFADNGASIQDISLKDIWLPGKTTRKAGTGLGLTIVRDAVSDLSGSVSADAAGEFGGASIAITLPLEGIENA
ncbi:MAG TPA: HAMP domain-containing histidine kinase, partial [Desulfobacterales bacterium]|nr:HAMP domain-containing histidine kinase [Desulfobacterales bacterium]